MHDDRVGETIAGRYQIIELIARGGMGCVYKALDKRLQKVVALKLFDPQVHAAFAQRFAEARVVAKRMQSLRHLNVLETFDIGKAGDQAYSVMEYIDGRSLAQMMAAGERFNPQRAIEIIRQVGGALDYLHQQKLVHRDVKPSNILVSNDGRAVLTDFGLVIQAGSPTQTEAGFIAGTPAYMSPEQAMGKSVDARSDMFSLSVVLYEMLTGVRPFSGASTEETLRNIAERLAVSPEKINVHLPAPLARVIMKSMMKEPAHRFPTIAAFLVALEEVTRVDLFGANKLTRKKKFETSVPIEDDTPTSVNLTPYDPAGRGAIAWLLILDPSARSKDERPRAFRLAESFNIGRNTDNDLVLFNYEVWHHHASISLENGHFFVSDLNSAHGTFVNGIRVEKSELHDRDQIRIGNETLLFIQAVSPKHLNVEAERRLQEFDAVWDQLASSARDE